VFLCLKKEEVYIVSLLLFENFKMYFYGTVVTELQHNIIWF
jgi:hypothetical protein